MSLFDYIRTQTTASRLIARFGTTGAIRRAASSGDAWNPTQTETDYACSLCVTDYTLRERESALIAATDRKVLISTAGLTIEPTAADQVVIDGTPHEVKRIDPLKPADTVVMWVAQCVF